MSIVTVISVLMCIAGLRFVWPRLTIDRLLICMILLIVHFVASYYYYRYSLTNIADSFAYYFYASLWKDQTIGLSTVLVANVVQFLKKTFGASYLECFLFFQSFGFIGLMIMARVFTEIEERVGVQAPRGYLALLFLPSVNFWTAAIGKDALLFFAISLCVWSMLRLRKRFLYFCVALTVMMLFRAHIALMAATAFAAAAFFEPSISVGRKAGLLTIALIGGWFALGAVQSTLGLDATSVSAIGGFLDKQNAVYATVAGTTSLGNSPFLVRVFSLLFRPFFFDATGIMGAIASVENLGVAIVTVQMLAHWRDLAHLMRRVMFVRFAAIFAFLILLSLTLIYYNVGLGLRQRVMAYPMIYSMLVALWSMRLKRVAAPAPDRQNRLLAEGKRNTAVPEV